MKLLSKSFMLSSAAAIALVSCGEAKPKALTASETVMSVKTAVENAELGKAWDALPVSYQKDITDITQTFATKVDKDVYNKVSSILDKVNTALTEKKEIYSEVIYDFAKAQPKAPKNQEEVSQGIESLTTVLSTLLKSDLASVETLKTIDIDKFLSGPASDVIAKVKTLSAGSTEENVLKLKKFFDSVKVDVVSETADASKLKITYFDGKTEKMETKEVDFAKFENKWLPKETIADWAKGIADAKAGLDKMSGEDFKKNKMQVMMMLGMADGIADQLGQVNSKADVIALIQNSPMGQMMMPQAPAMPAVPATPEMPEAPAVPEVKTPAMPKL